MLLACHPRRHPAIPSLSLALCALLPAAFCTACGRSAPRHPQNPSVVSPAAAHFLAGKNTRVYHHIDCLYARDIPPKQLVGFRNWGEAEASGRTPCAFCKPRQKDPAPEMPQAPLAQPHPPSVPP